LFESVRLRFNRRINLLIGLWVGVFRYSFNCAHYDLGNYFLRDALAADLCLIRSPYRKAAKPHHAFATPFGCREADFLATKYCFPSLHVRQMRSGCHWYFASSSSRRGLMSLMANFLATTRITRRRDPASGGKMPEKHLPGIWDLSVIKTNAVRAASALKDVGKLSRCAYQVAGVTMKDTASRGSPSLANSGTIITLLTRWP